MLQKIETGVAALLIGTVAIGIAFLYGELIWGFLTRT